MSYITRNLKQTATYWASPTSDGRGGYTFDTAAAVSVRWEDKQIVSKDANGKEFISEAIVYIDQDVDIGGFLYLGTSTETNPKDQPGAYKIMNFRKTPNLAGTEFERKVIL